MIAMTQWAVRGGFGAALALLLLAGSTSAASGQCAGDCNGNGLVAINELILAVNVVLGTASPNACRALAPQENGVAEAGGETAAYGIDDIVRAVSHSLNGCPPPPCNPTGGGRCVEITPGPAAEEAILGALIEAVPGDVIVLRAGRYDLSGQLSLAVAGVTVRGEGWDRTILSFAGQTTGAEGLLVQADRFTLEDLAVEDSPGDLFKIVGATGVTVRRVRAEWTGGPQTSNGAYGLYPVQCRDVLIEESIVRGASDAGIYVGQSRNIVVRRNRVELNVAGIEIENSTDADVYENVATANTGGILVFNLPGPPVQDGRRTRVYANEIYANNTPNFAPMGNSVAGVPTGTGVMVLANDEVEVFNNQLRDNDTAHVILISYITAAFFGQAPSTNPNFDPYSESVFIHGNAFSGGGEHPDPDLVFLLELLGLTRLPDILYDGDDNPALRVDGMLPGPLRTCVQQPGATFVDLDVAGGLMHPSQDLATVDCALDALSPVVIEGGRHIEIAPGPDAAEAILTALLEAEPGDDILIKAGRYEIDTPLSLTVHHVTVRGEGMDETVLAFDGLAAGGEGLLVQADDFTIEDIGLEDSPGDLLKILGGDGVTIRRVRAEWSGGADEDNGAYGLYPVQCKDVLIEDSVVKGASDAGIYVGQSRNILVRRNRVELNVAGIEIENSTGADVYDNVATRNTGGILVFNLPGLPVYGARTRVFMNEVYENNTPNFAPEGNVVAAVPAGTGLLILANDQVEVFDNQFRDNGSTQVTVIGFRTAQLLGLPMPNDPNFDAFTESVYVLDNSYDGGGETPDPSLDALVAILGGLPIPQIFVDGDEDPAKFDDEALPPGLRVCVQDPNGSFVNFNLPKLLMTMMPAVSFDRMPFDCALTRLTPIAIPGVR